MILVPMDVEDAQTGDLFAPEQKVLDLSPIDTTELDSAIAEIEAWAKRWNS